MSALDVLNLFNPKSNIVYKKGEIKRIIHEANRLIYATLFLMLVVVVPACTQQVTNEYQVVSTQIVVNNPGGMPSLCWAGNGDLLLAYATNWQPIPPSGGTLKLMRSTDEGRTWSEPRIIAHPKTLNQWSIHMWSGICICTQYR